MSLGFGGAKNKMGKSPNKSPKSKLSRLLVVILVLIFVFVSTSCGRNSPEDREDNQVQISEEETVDVGDPELEKFINLKQKMATFFKNPIGFLTALNNIGTINDDNAKQELDDLKNEMKKVLAVQTRIDVIDTSTVNLDSKDEIESISADLQDIDSEVRAFVNAEKHESAVRTINHLEQNTPQGKVIAAIFALSDITIESKSEIENIRAMYEALSDSEKSEIINYAQLTEAERQYDVLVIAAAEAGAAQAAAQETTQNANQTAPQNSAPPTQQNADPASQQNPAQVEEPQNTVQAEEPQAPAEEVVQTPVEEVTQPPVEEAAQNPVEEVTQNPAAAATQPAAPETQTADSNGVPEGCTYLGNSNSRKFHYTWCGSGLSTKEHNRVYFYCSRQEIIEKGYKPCGNCNP